MDIALNLLKLRVDWRFLIPESSVGCEILIQLVEIL